MEQDKVGKFIKKLRKSNHLTQKDLAEKLGVTYQAVSKWENGKNMPDVVILQEISKLFSVDIDEILGGASKKKHYKNLVGIILGIILIIVILIFYLSHSSNFEFKKISSKCDNFLVTGSAAYNKDKSAIYISNIEFCGKNEDQVYEKIDCTLYEKYEDKTIKIQVCDNKANKNISLEEYLKNVQINVKNYSSMCKKFSSSNLYLEINAHESENQIVSYKVPIVLEENCSSSN